MKNPGAMKPTIEVPELNANGIRLNPMLILKAFGILAKYQIRTSPQLFIECQRMVENTEELIVKDILDVRVDASLAEEEIHFYVGGHLALRLTNVAENSNAA